MKGKRILISLGFALLSIVILGRLSAEVKNLPGPYYLTHFKEVDDKYFIERKGCDLLGGPLEGTVSELGWNRYYILAKIKKHFGGDTDGWYAIDVKSDEIIGPLDRGMIRRDNRLNTIRTHYP